MEKWIQGNIAEKITSYHPRVMSFSSFIERFQNREGDRQDSCDGGFADNELLNSKFFSELPVNRRVVIFRLLLEIRWVLHIHLQCIQIDAPWIKLKQIENSIQIETNRLHNRGDASIHVIAALGFSISALNLGSYRLLTSHHKFSLRHVWPSH